MPRQTVQRALRQTESEQEGYSEHTETSFPLIAQMKLTAASECDPNSLTIVMLHLSMVLKGRG